MCDRGAVSCCITQPETSPTAASTAARIASSDSQSLARYAASIASWWASRTDPGSVLDVALDRDVAQGVGQKDVVEKVLAVGAYLLPELGREAVGRLAAELVVLCDGEADAEVAGGEADVPGVHRGAYPAYPAYPAQGVPWPRNGGLGSGSLARNALNQVEIPTH